jgi:protein-tyrosine kinase
VNPPRNAGRLAGPGGGEVPSAGGENPAIGELIRDARALSDDQIRQILAYQREKSVRFGEAAVALRLASRTDVLEALSRQFHYPYRRRLAARAHSGELVMAANPFSGPADAFRELRSRLMEALDGKPCRALAVLSQDVGDGKTYMAANLAVAFSQLEGRTLLIDADLRTPRLHHLLAVEYAAGLSSVLSGRAERAVVHQVPDLPNLYLLAAGPVPPNPLELLQRSALERLIREMLDNFDHVLVDTPAGVRGADARLIAARSGAALVIGRKRRSRVAALQGLLDALARGPAKVAGVVMNEH